MQTAKGQQHVTSLPLGFGDLYLHSSPLGIDLEALGIVYKNWLVFQALLKMFRGGTEVTKGHEARLKR